MNTNILRLRCRQLALKLRILLHKLRVLLHYADIALYNLRVARLNRLEIQVSNDDKTWKTVFRKETKTTLRGPTRTRPFIWRPEEPVSGRYVRIQLLDKQYLHLEQVEIYGPYDG